MWKHVWKGVWWKHFYATNACSLSSNSLLFPPPFSHLSPGANICVFLCLHGAQVLLKRNVGAIGDIFFLTLAAHDNSVLSKRALWKQAASSPVHARKRKRLALITSRQKTPLTNSKQGARSLSWLTGNTHTFMESVIPLRMRRDFDIARNYLLFVFVASSFPVKVTTANADGIELTWRTAW